MEKISNFLVQLKSQIFLQWQENQNENTEMRLLD